jgi:hypothetical protein
MSHLIDSDDSPHNPSYNPDWRESYYFNFVDPLTGISGFTTIGVLPNRNMREFVFVLFHGDKREVYYVESREQFQHNSMKSLSDDHLSYELVEPLNEWRIRFAKDSMSADINWKGRFPVCNFGGGSRTSWSEHFEQSGRISGSVNLPGYRMVKIEGMGQRDKSWGPRDWHIESWYALHAQFDSLSIALRRDMVNGAAHVSGAISNGEKDVAIWKVDLETKFTGTEPKIPVRATTRIYGVDKRCYTLHSSLISPTSFVRFARPFPGGSTELFEDMAIHECEELGARGTGLIEWLFTHLG